MREMPTEASNGLHSHYVDHVVNHRRSDKTRGKKLVLIVTLYKEEIPKTESRYG